MRTVTDATGLLRYTTTSRKKGGQSIFLVLGRIPAGFKKLHLPPRITGERLVSADEPLFPVVF